jgi:pimeloyl-ACP methyl ester carboxylesterase
LIFTDPSGLWPDLPTDEATLRLGRFKPCSLSAIGTPVSYAPFLDADYKGAVAYISMARDQFIPLEKAQENIRNGGIQLTKVVDGGHGIDIEAQEELVKAIKEFAAVFAAA